MSRRREGNSTASEVIGTFLHFRFFQAILQPTVPSSHRITATGCSRPYPTSKNLPVVFYTWTVNVVVLSLDSDWYFLDSRHIIRSRQYPAHTYALGFFGLPAALAAQVLLPCVQGQADGIASVINRGGAQVDVGYANVVEIKMLEIPTSGREDRRHRHLPYWLRNRPRR